LEVRGLVFELGGGFDGWRFGWKNWAADCYDFYD
jgi:hypothetical protein